MEPRKVPPELLGEVRRLVVLWVGRLGDFLVATPLLMSLRARFPGARIVLVAGEGNAEAARLCPDVDEVLVVRRFLQPAANLRVAAALLGSRADLLLDLNTGYSRTSLALGRLARARLKLGFQKLRASSALDWLLPPAAETEHMLDRYGRMAAALGADYEPTLRLRWTGEHAAAAREVLAAWFPAGEGLARVAFHPGNFRKLDNRWPEGKFVELTDRLADAGGCKIAYLAGPGERGRVLELVSRLARPVPVLGPLPLGVMAALLSELDLLVVNATGTAHLAAACGTPTLSFLGGYTKTVWMPRTGPHRAVVSDSWGSCRDITVDQAWEALRQALAVERPER